MSEGGREGEGGRRERERGKARREGPPVFQQWIRNEKILAGKERGEKPGERERGGGGGRWEGGKEEGMPSV